MMNGTERFSDQDLLLYFYDDGLALAERSIIAQALSTDADLSRRYAELVDALRTMNEGTAPLAPDAAQQRWRSALQREARLSAPPQRDRRGWLRSPGLAMACSAAVMISFGIGLGQWLAGRPDPQHLAPIADPRAIVSPVNDSDHGDRSPLLRGVQLHLHDTRALLRQSQAGQPEQSSLLADALTQNRMLIAAAHAQDDPDLARVLRAFNAALIDLAQDRADPEVVADERRQLRFEMAIVQKKLGRSPSNLTEVLAEPSKDLQQL